MSRKIFIWVANPKSNSLSAALADAYAAGARAEGAEIRRMDLADMSFDADFAGYGPEAPALEPDLVRWQDNIAWADHVFIVHPYWWSAMPARAKALLDRALAPGFGFKYHAKGVKWDKLLSGRTADAVITSDAPPLLDTLLYRVPGRRVLRDGILKFVGIRPRHVMQFGSVKTANPKKIANWLRRAEALGRTAA